MAGLRGAVDSDGMSFLEVGSILEHCSSVKSMDQLYGSFLK